MQDNRTLNSSQIERLRSIAQLRTVHCGEVLYDPSRDNVPMFVVLEGVVSISGTGDVDKILAGHGAGQFTGEMSVISGKRRDGKLRLNVTRPIRHVFVMAGAAPRTEWLEDSFALDKRGFIVTGPDLAAYVDGRWPLDRFPVLLETSVPGIFAVGDARAGSVKRVASAVGEGAMAVHLVHRYLADSEDQHAEATSKDHHAAFAGRQSSVSMMIPFSNGSDDPELAT